MGTLLHFVLRTIATVIAVATLAGACGDPLVNGTAEAKAKLVLQSESDHIRMGERVYANLILPQDSKLSTGTLRRAGCTSFQFKIEPASGWHDPWQHWYYSGIAKHGGGEDGPSVPCGIRGGRLPGQPQPPPQIDFTLNEWIQFDQPGKYTISLAYRARTPVQAPPDELPGERLAESWVTLTTDPIEVTVFPEAADVSERSANALTFLRSRFRDEDPWAYSPDSTPFPEWAAYSQSVAVIPLLAQFYEQSPNTSRIALLTNPHLREAVEEMQKSLASPRHSVSRDFVEILAFNRARLEHPELFARSSTNWWNEQWEADAKARNEAFLTALAQAVEDLLAALPNKQARAQSDCLTAVLWTLARWDVPNKSSLQRKTTLLAARLLPRMPDSPYMQDEHWKVIASPLMIPYLRRAVKESGSQQKRWLYELAPDEARTIVLAAAARRDWETVWDWSDVIAPWDRPSRVLDNQLMLDLRRNYRDQEMREELELLILKFGGAELGPRVHAIVDSQTCPADPALWSFLLKHEGTSAEDRLIRKYRAASAKGRCQADTHLQLVLSPDTGLPGAWKGYWSPALENIVVSQLDKQDGTALVAADLLGHFGSREAQAPLWARLEQWHRSPSLRPNQVRLEHDLERFLISALLNGSNWVLDREAVERLHKQCVFDCEEFKWTRSVQQVQYLTINDWPGGVRYSISLNSSPLMTIEEFRAWMRRYPAGTKFIVSVSPGGGRFNAEELEAADPGLSRLLQERKLEVLNLASADIYGRCIHEPGARTLQARE